MANVALTYTIQNRRILHDSTHENIVKIVTDTGDYTANGIALSLASLGLPNFLESLTFIDAANATTDIYKYDYVNKKIRIYVEGVAIYAEKSGAMTATTLYVKVVGY